MRSRAGVIRAGVALAALAGLGGCEGATEPPYAVGRVSFEWAEEGGVPAVWTAEGSCGAPSFELGGATCAVGSDERARGYWAVLGVLLGEAGSFGVVTLVHPRTEGPCQASAAAGTTCGLAFEPVHGTAAEPVYVLTSGVITVTLMEAEGVERLAGTFEGTAADPSGVRAPLAMTAGTFDVELVR